MEILMDNDAQVIEIESEYENVAFDSLIINNKNSSSLASAIR